MNERIRQLAEQAKEYADTKYSKLVSASRWGDCVPGIRELYTEKFAELIVRECADKAYKTAWDDLTHGYGQSVVPLHIHNDLLEHFGVQE